MDRPVHDAGPELPRLAATLEPLSSCWMLDCGRPRTVGASTASSRGCQASEIFRIVVQVWLRR